MVADSAVEIEALRWLVLTAAWQVDQGVDSRQAQSMAKLYGGVKANEIVDRVLQMHGGMGYTRELPVERWYRELRVLRIYEGTDEIQRRTIARNLLSGHSQRAGPSRMTGPRPAGSSGTPTTGTTGRSTTCSRPRARRAVSLVVPARNEAATVGDVVDPGPRARWSTRSSCSTRSSSSTPTRPTRRTPSPRTPARSCTAPRRSGPDLGTQPGKGEAMWKSLFVTTGDVLVFMDADLLDWDTHFVPGPARAAADPARRSSWSRGSTSGRWAAATRRTVRGRPGHRAGRPAADPAAVPGARRAAPAAGGGVGGAPVAVRGSCASRTGTPSSWPPSSTPSARAASTRSRRSTSAPAPTGTSPCATCPAWPPRSSPRRSPASAPAPEVDERPPGGERRMTLRLGRHAFADDATLMMAIVNRTPDSFYDKGATWAEDKAFERVALVVEPGRGDRRHRRHQGRARRRDRRRRGEGARGRLRGPGARGVPRRRDLGRHLAGRGRRRRVRGRGRRPQRRLGRRRPGAGRRRGRARRRDRLHPHRRRDAADPALPDRVRRRGRRRDRRHRRLRRAGRRRRRRPGESS